MNDVLTRLVAARKALKVAEDALYEVKCILINSKADDDLTRRASRCQITAEEALRYVEQALLEDLEALLTYDQPKKPEADGPGAETAPAE